jgi:hypothetical protein
VQRPSRPRGLHVPDRDGAEVVPPLCTPKLKTSIPSQSPGPSRSSFFLSASPRRIPAPLMYHGRMAVRRRRRGFEPAGACTPRQLGLSARRSREIELAVAWREVAGEVLAGRARALAVRRGTLEVQVDGPRWEETLEKLLPRLAARLARRHPELQVRRCRLLVQDGDAFRRGEALRLETVEPTSDEPRDEPVDEDATESDREATGPEPDLEGRLARLGERYELRAEGRQVRTGSARRPAGRSDPR